jgi:hypothetical protein
VPIVPLSSAMTAWRLKRRFSPLSSHVASYTLFVFVDNN